MMNVQSQAETLKRVFAASRYYIILIRSNNLKMYINGYLWMVVLAMFTKALNLVDIRLF